MADSGALDTLDLKSRVDAAVDTGMCVAVWAQEWPERTAVTEAGVLSTRVMSSVLLAVLPEVLQLAISWMVPGVAVFSTFRIALPEDVTVSSSTPV